MPVCNVLNQQLSFLAEREKSLYQKQEEKAVDATELTSLIKRLDVADKLLTPLTHEIVKSLQNTGGESMC